MISGTFQLTDPNGAIDPAKVFADKLHRSFRDGFDSAKLYQTAERHLFPPSSPKVFLVRRGWAESERQAVEISDWLPLHPRFALRDGLESEAIDELNTLGHDAGILVDGLMRIESMGRYKGQRYVVTDVFGTREAPNLVVNYSFAPNADDMAGRSIGWVAYRFHFAVAAMY
jgi:hypothetical protein